MPVFVDHDRRRQELAEIAYELIAQGGTEAATIRKKLTDVSPVLTNRHQRSKSSSSVIPSRCLLIWFSKAHPLESTARRRGSVLVAQFQAAF